MDKLELPHEVKALFEARNQLRDTMNSGVAATGSEVQLKFTLDGNLVGDIGEALSVIHFGIKLVDTAAHPGIDGFAPDGRSVQVKATGTGRGAAFRQTEIEADHLLVFDLDLQNATAAVLYNGPERYIRDLLPTPFTGQRSVTRSQLVKTDAKIEHHERLKTTKPTA
ncbi:MULTISPECIES: DUF6998 domain-containing protein [unclassified Brucella]|uniref:DUF6998 domain-containing protein n=1 Tax=unclassified Brucella TaxID=2632610 RepID=UPI00217E124F|nr:MULTISPECIES: hypothetical protein [unclassified Brucella]UWF67386.1 hypothetical protein NYO63_04395 [Brucella sp. 1315]UWF70511.1 hypothetical protein NYO65_04395 [Brucella sp. 2594]